MDFVDSERSCGSIVYVGRTFLDYAVAPSPLFGSAETIVTLCEVSRIQRATCVVIYTYAVLAAVVGEVAAVYCAAGCLLAVTVDDDTEVIYVTAK